MAQLVAGRSDAVKPESLVSVPASQRGVDATVSSVGATELKLGFDPGVVDAAREGNDLAFTFDAGGSVRISDFFVVEETLPVLVLPNGDRVSAADYLAATHPDLDLSTAAGPTAQAPESGGTNYSDAAGNLLGGIETLDDQATGAGWDRMFPLAGEVVRVERLAAAGPDVPGGVAPGPSYTPLRTMHLRHFDPIYDPNQGYEPKGEYRYTARMATGAVGKGASADGLEVPGAWDNGDFRLNVLADNATMTPETGDSGSTVTGVLAVTGGRASIDAGAIDIAVTGQGFEGGSGSSVVGAVFAQGAEVEGSWWDSGYRVNHAEVALRASGDVNLGVGITGDAATRDHSGITYAGVSASDRGHVTVESGGDVAIAISDQTTGGALDADGVYGIYSGYGLRNGDLPKRSDFASDDEYRDYMYRLQDQYRQDTSGDWSGSGYLPGTDQTLVNIKAAGDVEVKLDLGSTEGPVSGLRLECGDAHITAGGDINFTTSLRGVHSGGGIDKASAVSITDGGQVRLAAKGDVNLSLDGDGRNMSAVYIGDGPIAVDSPGVGSMAYGPSGTIYGRNINITGTAGTNGVADVNEIIGLEMGGKKNKFLLSADEKISIDVTTLHRGNEGSATGVMLHNSVYHHSSSNLYLNAPEVEIAARIKPADAASAGLAHDTTATAFHVESANVRVRRGSESNYGPHITEEGMLHKLDLAAEGGRRNYGLLVTANDRPGAGYAGAMLDLDVKDLNIRAAGGVADGQGSASYGIAVNADDANYAAAYLTVGTLSVTVENPEHSVGLSADGGQFSIINGYLYDPNTGQSANLPLTVIISCTITDPSALPAGARAVAIEALNGGYVDIGSGNEYGPPVNDTIILNGDVLAQGGRQSNEGSSIAVSLGNGSDRVEINGDIKTEGAQSSISINTGSGGDVLVFSGKIHASAGIDITAGAGNDLLVLKAESAEAFAAQFKDWLETPGVLARLSCESIIIQGLDPAHGQTWLSNLLAANPNIDVQYFGPDTNVTMVNSAEQLGETFHLAGAGNDDLLYLRFDDAENGLKSMNKAVSEGRVSGLEKLVLDIANGHNDGGLNTDLLNNLIGGAKGNGSEVRLRADTTDAGLLQNAGWSTDNNTATIDGTDYTVYNHPELGNMYVKLITG